MHPTPSTSSSPAPSQFVSLDGSSPTKRRKLAPPSPASSIAFPIPRSTTPTLDPQLDTERRASSARVLDVWFALEEKYARRLDEDDIVDLRSGALLMDRGVLSSTARNWNIGCFADNNGEEGDEDDEDDEDDGDDEIGGWGSEADLDHQFAALCAVPTPELSPQDSEDLKEFLATEEARRAEECGLDDEVEVTDGGEDADADADEDGAKGHNDGVAEYDMQDTISTHDDHTTSEVEESIVDVDAESALEVSSDCSDDELAGFDDTVGEGALLWSPGSNIDEPEDPIPPMSFAKNSTANAQSNVPKDQPALTPPLSRSVPPSPGTSSLSEGKLLRSDTPAFKGLSRLTSISPVKSVPFKPLPTSPIKSQTSAPSSFGQDNIPIFDSSTVFKRDVPDLKPELWTKHTKRELSAPASKHVTREMSLSPTKNLFPEVILPAHSLFSSPKKSISGVAGEKVFFDKKIPATSSAKKPPSVNAKVTPTKPKQTRRRTPSQDELSNNSSPTRRTRSRSCADSSLSSGSPTRASSRSQSRSKHTINGKRKRILGDGSTEIDLFLENDNNSRQQPQPQSASEEEEEVLSVSKKSSSRRSFSCRSSSTQHPSTVEGTPLVTTGFSTDSSESWRQYARLPAAYPVPPPQPPHPSSQIFPPYPQPYSHTFPQYSQAPGPSAMPALDPEHFIDQVMSTLSYLVRGIPLSPTPQLPPGSLPPSPWSFHPHTQSSVSQHAPWPYPSLHGFHYPPQPPPSSPLTPVGPTASFASSSPLYKRSRKKRVSFSRSTAGSNEEENDGGSTEGSAADEIEIKRGGRLRRNSDTSHTRSKGIGKDKEKKTSSAPKRR
ncbi:hypothetical protein BU17DRAFT_92435 [Hysterangium stoloniferum]|nr:hypothetical protein BU17DRAFT_92435 [Hysterangium stoloniferum]